MRSISHLVEAFWKWTGKQGHWNGMDITKLSLEPLSFPRFEELRNLCISMINAPLSESELDAFLFCMALDSEEEYILDACKKHANVDFLSMLLRSGMVFPQRETRWQMSELMKGDIPHKKEFLDVLLSDEDAYVRKRAGNIANEH